MPRTKTLRLAALLTVVAALTATLVAPRAHGPQSSDTKDKIALASYPTNAGKIFKWGHAQWYDNFVGSGDHKWAENHPRLIRNQHGMQTINGTAHSGSVSATLGGHARTYGRWEARVRAEQYTRKHTPFKVVWELIPVGKYHCGSKSIVLSSYKLGSKRAHMSVGNGGSRFTASKARNLGAGPFHTYAVEVTKTHVSWFVDTHVIRTERRPAALSGAKFKVRFRLVATKGATMNPGRMQMDWVRYYTLQRKNAKSIKAPQMHAATNAKAC